MYIGLLVSQVRHVQSGTHPEAGLSQEAAQPHRLAGLWLRIKHLFS
jgi:hypothetical protein